MNSLATRLRDKGLKVTPQRMAIYAMLYGSKAHPTAERVWEDIKEQFPAVSFNTVYTTLNAFEKCGLVQRLHIGENIAHYDASVQSHVHMACRQCGKVEDCEESHTIDTEALAEQLAKSQGYRVDKVELNIYGLCPQCT